MFHIDSLTGEVESCFNSDGWCKFGGFNTHFRYAHQATEAYARRQAEFNEWLSRSAYPLEEGWVVEHVYDPERPGTYYEDPLIGQSGPPVTKLAGTRLVLENGYVWVKLPYGTFWEMAVGEDQPFGLRKRLPVDAVEFFHMVEEFGGRIEYREGIRPIHVRWGRDFDYIPKRDAGYSKAMKERANKAYDAQEAAKAAQEEREIQALLTSARRNSRPWWRRLGR